MPSNRRCLHSPVDITKALQLRIYLHDFDLKKKKLVAYELQHHSLKYCWI